ncbi:unannotated protein [freshwater metagenome]|uniref:Unannotated protein n=1 Tax=freshwater metagenome TaxID=449393 RepID=A0A6J7UXD1_9ZZZZ
MFEAVEFVAEDLAGNRVEEAVDDRAPIERLGGVQVCAGGAVAALGGFVVPGAVGVCAVAPVVDGPGGFIEQQRLAGVDQSFLVVSEAFAAMRVVRPAEQVDMLG